MRGRLAAFLLVPMFLGGCALPLEYNLASYAIDGLSYLFSGKTATDHALSGVADRDCALLRAMDGDEICHEYAMPDDRDGGELAGPVAPMPVVVEALPAHAEDAQDTRGGPILVAARPMPKPQRAAFLLDDARPQPKPATYRPARDRSVLAEATPREKPLQAVGSQQVALLGR